MQRQNSRPQPHPNGQEGDQACFSESGFSNGFLDVQHSSVDHAASRPQNPQLHDHRYGFSPLESGHPHQQYDARHRWQVIPRSWEAINPEANQATQDPALNRTISTLSPESRESHSHVHMSHQSESCRSYRNSTDTSTPQLTASRLRHFDDGHASTTNMLRWMSANQRDGAWDGVGQVKLWEDGNKRSSGC